MIFANDIALLNKHAHTACHADSYPMWSTLHLVNRRRHSGYDAAVPVLIGTSGWQYAHWKRVFYPDKMPAQLA